MSPQIPTQSMLRSMSPQSPLQSPLRSMSPQSPPQSSLRFRSPQSPLRSGSPQSPLHSKSPQSPVRSGSPQSLLQSPLRSLSPQRPLQSLLRSGSPQNPLKKLLLSSGGYLLHLGGVLLCWPLPDLLLCLPHPGTPVCLFLRALFHSTGLAHHPYPRSTSGPPHHPPRHFSVLVWGASSVPWPATRCLCMLSTWLVVCYWCHMLSGLLSVPSHLVT